MTDGLSRAAWQMAHFAAAELRPFGIWKPTLVYRSAEREDGFPEFIVLRLDGDGVDGLAAGVEYWLGERRASEAVFAVPSWCDPGAMGADEFCRAAHPSSDRKESVSFVHVGRGFAAVAVADVKQNGALGRSVVMARGCNVRGRFAEAMRRGIAAGRDDEWSEIEAE